MCTKAKSNMNIAQKLWKTPCNNLLIPAVKNATEVFKITVEKANDIHGGSTRLNGIRKSTNRSLNEVDEALRVLKLRNAESDGV